MCVCVCGMRERDIVCVCVCEREREEEEEEEEKEEEKEKAFINTRNKAAVKTFGVETRKRRGDAHYTRSLFVTQCR